MIRLRQGHHDAEVVIAGAGPAGAAAAAHLARAGIPVTLLDQSRFPRDKVCGDFVSPVALDELRVLGVTRSADYAASNQINSAALYLDGERLLTRPFPAKPGLPPYGRVIPRERLDAWVVEAARRAGARILEGVRVTGYAMEPGGVRVDAVANDKPTSFRARLLIGADGSTSLIGKQLRGYKLEPKDRIVAIRAYYRKVRGAFDQADIYFSAASFPGYYWVFPTGEGTANVGVGVALDTLPPSEVKLKELLQHLVDSDPCLRDRLGEGELVGKIVGWPLATYNPALPLAADRVMLVGDAANLINPINGEGIQTALLSGRWAAEVVAAAREEDYAAAALATYTTKVENELRYDMALSCFLVQCIRNSTLNPLWLRALRVIAERARKDEVYADIAGGILAGVVPASSALSPRLVLGTLQQAVMSLGSFIGGPLALAETGIAMAQLGGQVLRSAFRDPQSWARWVLRTAGSAAELAGQATLGLRTAPPPRPAPVLASAEPRFLLSGLPVEAHP
ncbi:MAG TPA: geranylgeranyl reductase family protein [Myxococcaceae bacterium]|jgi:geranylgeranyl reductase family protein